MELEALQPLVFDNGSSISKVGRAGYDVPEAVFLSVVGRLKPQARSMLMAHLWKDIYVGEDAIAKRGIMRLTYPIEQGVCTNWSDVEEIWRHSFYNELRVSPEEHPVLLTEPVLNPKANREKMAEIMFDVFKVLAICIQIKEVLALFALKKSSGAMLRCGETATWSVPIYEYFIIPHGIRRMNLGGRHIEDYFARLSIESGIYFNHIDRTIAKDMKEKLCFVSQDYERDVETEESEFMKHYEFSNGNVVQIGKNRFKAPEILFNPSLIRSHVPGVVQLLNESILKCATDIRPILYRNIILIGGSTRFEGFGSRFRKEMREWVGLEIEVIAPDNKYLIWSGGSILASEDYDQMWLWKDEYISFGPGFVSAKPDKKLILLV